MSNEIQKNSAETHEMEIHIPTIQGEYVSGLSLGGIPVSNTILSMWLFMALLFIVVGFLFTAIKTRAFPRLRNVGIDLVKRIDDFFIDAMESKKHARTFLPLVGGFFVYIFLSNVFGLGLDWLNFIIEGAHNYLRPINSDLNTTVVMAVTVILVSQITAIRHKGFFTHFGHYLFNFSGHTTVEKIINVPIGWLHFVGEFTRALSLSVRLFANIFAGVILIGVMTYVGKLIPTGGVGL
jgi:F-type H+-transporting ATPase subunit a